MTGRTRTAALAAALASLASIALADPTPPAPAGDTEAQAAKLFDEGKRHFDIGEYQQAITSWKQAYLISSVPLLLFNIGQAYRLSNNCAQANRFYLNYKRIEPKPSNAIELEQAMAKCAGVAPAVGDSDAGEGSAGSAAAGSGNGSAVDAGSGSGSGGAMSGSTGSAGSGSADTGAGSAMTTAPSTPPPPPVNANPGHTERLAGYIVGGVGGVMLLGALGLQAKANSDSTTVEGYPKGTPLSTLQNTLNDGHNAANGARGLAILGGVFVVGGGTLWYLGHRKQSQSHFEVSISPSHSEVTYTCAF